MTLNERLWKTFNKALGLYQLIDEDDKILVGLSGGKDSLCLLEFLARRSKIHVPRFSVEALHVRMENIHYESDTAYLQSFCDTLGVPLHIITTRFEDKPQASNLKSKPACFLCSWQRRKQLFNLAQELGCNKIALGHHQDDIIHTALMNLTFQGHFVTMPAFLQMKKMPLAIIRPLCLCEEADIKAYAEQQGYEKQLKTCPYEKDTNRTTVKELFEKMRQLNSEARYSIWNALEEGNRLVQRLTVCLLLFLTMTVSAQRRHQVVQKKTQPQEQTTELSEGLLQMILATQRMMFIDSMVVPKTDFLSAYRLTLEAGRIAPYSTFFPKSKLSTTTYMNALNNRCVYPSDSSLVAQDYLQQQWTKPDTLAGINQERKLHHICYPFMMPDGITLYFAAEGEESIGGFDIFMTTYDPSEGQFLAPKNIGMPFNSTANDYMLAIDEYNQLGFFASDRNQPDSMVCVYTFIPAEKYQTYDSDQYTIEQINAFARIDSIRMTWDDERIRQEAVKRLEQVKKSPSTPQSAFSFVINDQLTYHHLKDFRVVDNQKRYQELLELRRRYDHVIVALEKARNYYTKASAKEREILTREILEQEKMQHELYHAIHQQEKTIRQAENNYLTKQ